MTKRGVVLAGSTALAMLPAVAEQRVASSAVSITAEGAVGDADTPATNAANVAAFAAAFARSRSVSCSGGRTFFVASTVRIPINAQALSGPCTVAAGVSFPKGQPVIEADHNIGLTVTGVEAVADLARFPGSTGFRFTGQTHLVLEGVRARASLGIFDDGSTDTRMTGPVVADYDLIGILAVNETGVVIDGAEVSASRATTTVGHCIQIGGRSRFGRVSNGSVHHCGYGFGVSIAGTSTDVSSDMTVRGMHTFATRAEGINFTNVVDFVAADNVESFDGDTTDFGLSVTSDNDFPTYSGRGLIVENRIEGSCKAGVALASKVTETIVADNQIVDAGSCLGRSAAFTAAVDAKGVMTVSSAGSGRIGWFDTVRGAGIPTGTTIRPFGSDGTTGKGGVGTYKLSSVPLTAVSDEAVESLFSDPDHSKFGILVYGVADRNVVRKNFVSDQFDPPHLKYAQGELSHAGTPADNTFSSGVTNGSSGGTLIIGRGSKQVEATSVERRLVPRVRP